MQANSAASCVAPDFYLARRQVNSGSASPENGTAACATTGELERKPDQAPSTACDVAVEIDAGQCMLHASSRTEPQQLSCTW